MRSATAGVTLCPEKDLVPLQPLPFSFFLQFYGTLLLLDSLLNRRTNLASFHRSLVCVVMKRRAKDQYSVTELFASAARRKRLEQDNDMKTMY